MAWARGARGLILLVLMALCQRIEAQGNAERASQNEQISGRLSSLGRNNNRRCNSFFAGLNVNLGVCDRRTSVLFSIAEKEGASATGSIRASGYLFIHGTAPDCPLLNGDKYRTFDGTCNHPNNLGSSFRPVARLISADYEGNDAPRAKGKRNIPLPSARLVSKIAHPAFDKLKDLTIMVMQWGQWVDHDITGLPVATEEIGPIKCCGPDNTKPVGPTNENCFPIELPTGDTDFVGSCMEFIRSLAATDDRGRELKPREQINSLTSFIDASQVYGSTNGTADLLRDPGYLLRTKNDNFLPESTDDDCIKRPGTNDYCFVAGDIRVNEQPALAALHTIWMREHNRIASQLRALRPGDSDEDIFQVTRKIIGALMQKITYTDWLPIIIGDREAQQFDLKSDKGRSTYSRFVDPRVLNSFATAAMRFGHSTIPDAFPIGARRVPLRQVFFRPAEVLDNLDDLLAGISGVVTEKLQEVDRNFVSEITKHLFEPEGQPGRGLDLVALNIQRGRDHGIPSYNKFRQYCHLRKVRSFNDEELGPNGSELANVYSSVDDIDLFTGMSHEPVERGADGLVGPTFRCLLKTQFFRLKFGDRFFFDTHDQGVGFNDAQLASIRATSLASVLCKNTEIPSLPTDVFRFPSYFNPLTPCDQLKTQGLDLSLWASY